MNILSKKIFQNIYLILHFSELIFPIKFSNSKGNRDELFLLKNNNNLSIRSIVNERIEKIMKEYLQIKINSKNLTQNYENEKFINTKINIDKNIIKAILELNYCKKKL